MKNPTTTARLALIIFCLCCGVEWARASASELPRASFLGVQAAAVTDELRSRLGLASNRGVVITGLVEGGSAKAAGLRPDDVIIAVDDQPIASPSELVARIGAHRAGERVSVRWIRDGSPRAADVEMKPRPFESAPGTRTEYGAVSVNGSLRRTIVVAPVDEARHPALLYITGIGCFSQESLGVQTTEAKLLHGLARAGFVTMRVEKSGVGDSQGPTCDSAEADLRAEIAGYVAGLRALKALPGVRADRVYIVGLSIGGVEAPLIAQQIPVQGVVVVNTVAKPFIEYLLETRRRQGVLKDVPFDELDRRLRLSELCNHALLIERELPDALLRRRPECKEYIDYPAPYSFMQQWAALDVAAEWKRVDVPVLVVQGEQDFIATAGDAPLLRDIINSFHPGRATLAMIPSMDHYLTRAASMKESMAAAAGGPFDAQVLETVREWLARQAAG